jgi:uncharacterized protein
LSPEQNFLEITVKAIVDHPDDIKITRLVDEMGVLLKLQVNEADMPKVVGKSGQTVKSLKTLLRLIGSKINLRINLKIIEPDGSEGPAKKNNEQIQKTKPQSEAKEDFENVI